MAVKFKATWRKELTWHQDIKWDVNLDKSLHSVSFPKLFLYHLDHKYAGFLTTIEEKKIKLILKGEGRKIILSFLLPFLLPPSAFCWAPSTLSMLRIEFWLSPSSPAGIRKIKERELSSGGGESSERENICPRSLWLVQIEMRFALKQGLCVCVCVCV